MKKYLLLLVALVASATAWAIEQDGDGNYLIGSVADWDAFAEIVNTGTNTSANAKMIADVDLSDDQTMIGTESNPFKGTFDGGAYTLTIAFNSTQDFTAPFSNIGGATIKNLRVTGTITTTKGYAGGLVGNVPSGTNYIKTSISSVSITTTQGGREWIGGMVGRGINSGTLLYIDDCFCEAQISAAWAANFVGIMQNSGKVYTTNSLSIATCENATQFNSIYHYIYGSGVTNNTFIVNCAGTSTDHGTAGTMVTYEQLANGSIATALQAGRSEEVWKQDEDNGIPVLRIFHENTSTGLIDINAAQPKSGQRYNMMGQPVGKDYKGIVIQDGKKIIVR